MKRVDGACFFVQNLDTQRLRCAVFMSRSPFAVRSVFLFFYFRSTKRKENDDV